MTPFEAWHGSKPKVNHLRVFGSDVYAHIPKDERSKFDSKTRKCIMLDMEQSLRDTDSMMSNTRKYCTVGMYSSTRTPNKLSKAHKMRTTD